MENELKQQLTRLRLATIAMRHNVRHAFDEFRERFASWRPTETEAVPVTESRPGSETSWTVRFSTHRRALFHGVALALLFGLSVAAGMSLKSWADGRITIGHEDYRLVPAERLYDLNALREKALANGTPLAVDTKPVYPVCSDDIDVPIDEAAL